MKSFLVIWNKNFYHLRRTLFNFFLSEVKEFRQWVSIRQRTIRIPQFVKENMTQSLHRSQPFSRRVDQQLADQINCFWSCFAPEHFISRVRLDFRELKLIVVWVHTQNLISCRSA